MDSPALIDLRARINAKLAITDEELKQTVIILREGRKAAAELATKKKGKKGRVAASTVLSTEDINGIFEAPAEEAPASGAADLATEDSQ